MTKGLNGKTVKSAQRVLEVLQYVSDSDREVTVMDIARDLAYPQSSTSELLGCLVHLGYMRYDRMRRTFRPTARVAAIGHHVGPHLFRSGSLYEMIDRVIADLDAPVMIGMIHQGMTMHVHVAGDHRPVSQFEPACPLRHAMGKILLSQWSEEAIRALIHRRNAECGDKAPIRASEFIEEITAIRRAGYCVTDGCNDFAGRIISIRLPNSDHEELSMATVVTYDASEDDIIDAVTSMRAAVSQQFDRQTIALSPLHLDKAIDRAPIHA